MGELVYIYADKKSIGSGSDQPSGTAPKRAAATGARAIQVTGIQSLKDALKKLLSDKVVIERLVIETHGNPGVIYLGADTLDVTKLKEFNGQGFEGMFAENARVFLNGCNIAKTGHDCGGSSCVITNGRDLLRELAIIFLIKSGGRVGASTSLGTVWGGFSDKVYHLPGFETDKSGPHWETSDTVYAYIKKGSSKVRIAVGNELSTPVMNWKVFADGKTWYYKFTTDGGNKVDYSDGSIFGGQKGNGTWHHRGDVIRVDWESGSAEEWDLPLFSREQTIRWLRKDGGIDNILARKELDSSRWTD